MCLRGLCAMLLVAGCYEPPAAQTPCAITCTDTCPGALTCSGGFCVEPGQTCQPAFTQVSAGTGFACGLDDAGALWCWGGNTHHQIDPGDRLQFPVATRLPGGPWTQVEAGGSHVCAISAGRLFCWGANNHGQVGPVTGDVTAPFEIVVPDGPSTWTSVSTGNETTCAIGDGIPYCWGRDTHGNLGAGLALSYQDVNAPTRVVTNLTDWTAVASGPYHSCGISASAGVLCWGYGVYGAVGPNATGDSPMPIVALPEPARAVAVSEYASCAAKADGTLWCWGNNTNMELGEANAMLAGQSFTPVKATTVTGWTQLAADTTKLCGLAGDAVYCWGSEVSGGLGNGVWAETRKWAKVATGASSVSLGWNYSYDPLTGLYNGSLELGCALIGSDAQCWGDNRFGQLGTGAATMQLVPREVAGGHLFAALGVGEQHACGLEGGSLWCWGSTTLGAVAAMTTGAANPRTPCMPGLDCDVGTPKQIAFVTGVGGFAVGSWHTCALSNDVISCWGDNTGGQLGTTAPGPIRRTVAQPGGRPWQALIPMGAYGQCATPGAGETWCWGTVLQYHPTPAHEAALDGIKQLSGGYYTSCVLDAAGMLACRGEASLGEFGTPSGGTCGDGTCNAEETQVGCPADCGSGLLVPLKASYTQLAVSRFGKFVCGIAPDQTVACWGVNTRGQTGALQSGSTALLSPTYEPHVLDGIGGCTQVVAGNTHACALCNGKLWCWGDDSLGQLGDGQNPIDPVTRPQAIELQLDGDPWIQLAAGYDFTCARSTAGHVYCWGADGHAGLGNGGTSANLPVTVVATPPR